ncbi:MAG: hypothetical protein JW837_12925 [Sedimentisphaerales bacterium]|nr:hypothetical protein [Sedimentisphaerales bacterium]
MHSDHDVFIEAIEKKRIIKLTYFNRDNHRNLSKECAPLHYSKGKTEGDDLDSYYIWDFGAIKGGHFLALPSSQILSIELMDRKFDVEDFSNLDKEKTPATS